MDGGVTAGYPSYRDSEGQQVLYFFLGFVAILLSVSGLAISLPFGLVATFGLTLGMVTLFPASAPVIILAAFMLQNWVIATYADTVPDDAAFDAMRGANFVILMTAYGAFLLASFQRRVGQIPHMKSWLLASLGLLGVITFYTGLGAIAGEPRDALVYFRNTIGAVACFHVGLVAASLYRVELSRPLTWLAAILVCYGYFELFFTLDFLSLFGGDLYLERDMRRQFDTGFWEKALEQTGFVYLGLRDAMTADFFNTSLFGDIFPKVFRIGGPNFHPISFAYGLVMTSIFLLLRGKWLIPLLAFPLLLIIGSKGAMVLFFLALLVQVGLKVLPVRTTLGLLVLAACLWISAAIVIGSRSGDYHVLGFFAGLREFLGNPLGHGIGIGGNLSSSSEHLDWTLAQTSGSTDVPVESAVGVMLYQMGIGALGLFAFLAALTRTCYVLFRETGERDFLFGFVGIVVLSANAVLQEEAFYSPLALGFCLLVTGQAIGSSLRSPTSR